MPEFKSILTDIGLSKINNVIASGETIALTQMAVGDGNDAPTTPNVNQTTLVNERHRAALSKLLVDPQNPSNVIVEMIIPVNIGGWTVHEVGIFDADGDMIAVANFPATYKALMAEGSARDLVIRIYINVGNAAAVTLLIDPSVVLASQNWVQNNATVSVASLKSLPTTGLQDGVKYSVTGFYAGSNVGGGDFVYDATISKAGHNGGTVITPEALIAWDGTFADIETFLDWAGSGSGCFVRKNSHPSLRLTLHAEMFGSPETNPSFLDETAIHQKMWDLATNLDHGGAEIELFRLYAVNGLRTDGVGRRAVRVVAASGVDYKRGLFVKGYCPVTDNQDCILKFGGDDITGDSEATYFEGVTIYGRDMNFTKGMVWVSRLSQGAFRFCAFRRARAPALYLQKLEDWDFYNCNFASLCGNDGRGAIVFTEPPQIGGSMSIVGNNAIRFNQGRIEFIDGPMISTEGANAWASTVTFIGTKFESGVSLQASGDPLGSALYGDYSLDYPVFKILEGVPLRIAIQLVAGCSFSGVSLDRSAGLCQIYRAGEFSCTDSLISGSGSQQVKLFDIQGPLGEPGEVLNFIFKDNSARVFGDTSGTTLDYLFVNKNKYAINFEYPINGTTDTNKAYRTAGKNLWFMSEHAERTTHFNLVPNPDNESDPAASNGRTVLTNISATANVWFRLNRNGLDGQRKGFMPTHNYFSVGIRAKTEGASNFGDGYRLALRDDAGELLVIPVNSATLQWHRRFLLLPAGRGTNLRFINIANAETAKIYIDAVEILPQIEAYVDQVGTASVSAIAAGDTISLSISVAGLNPGMFYIFSFDNSSAFLNARITSYVPFGGNLRVQIENLNASAAFDAVTLNWRVRRFL